MALFGLLGGKKTSVGLDIGSGIIKLVVIDHSGSEPELAKVATTAVAADAIVEGEVMDPGIVAEAIRGLFSTAGVKQRSVVTAVGRRSSTCHSTWPTWSSTSRSSTPTRRACR